MIRYLTGNLLEANVQALVNTVNTVGVMGKGIALQFKERFPLNFKLYAEACKKGEVGIGKMFVVKENTFNGEKIIINFPTKTEWFMKSQYAYIEEGLKDLVNVIKQYQIQSIAIPPLGSGNGGLKWANVKSLMNQYLGDIPVDILIYEPNEAVKEVLQKEAKKKNVNLTAIRAMLLYSLAMYEKRGETPSVFAANKIAYFLQESGEPLRLDFVQYTYGPYTQAMDKLLYALNGKYIKGLEQMESKPFEPITLNYERMDEVNDFVKKKLSSLQRDRLKSVFSLIEGFESSMSLEILSSIHFLLRKNKSLTKVELFEQVQNWNNRKKGLIKERHIDIAVKHLEDYESKMAF